MSLHPSTPRRARVATAIVLSSCLSALSLEACAESTEAGPDRADGSVVAPSPDVDAGTVPDGASDRDGALPDVPCAVSATSVVGRSIPSAAMTSATVRVWPSETRMAPMGGVSVTSS